MMQNSKARSKTAQGGSMEMVGQLHQLALSALIQQLKTEMEEGCVKAATVTAALKLCSDSGVTATVEEGSELQQLTQMVAHLDLSPVGRY